MTDGFPSALPAAVVPAAGAGTRLWPYSVVRDKAALPVANVPVVRRLVDDLAQLGIEQVVVLVGEGEASVRHALRGCYQVDGNPSVGESID